MVEKGLETKSCSNSRMELSSLLTNAKVYLVKQDSKILNVISTFLDSDVDIGSNVSEKVDSEWQENWSFIGKSNKVISNFISNLYFVSSVNRL